MRRLFIVVQGCARHTNVGVSVNLAAAQHLDFLTRPEDATMDNVQHIVSSLDHAYRSPFETVKAVLFWYVLATQTVRVCRHLRARGLRRSVVDGYVWTSKVRHTHPRAMAALTRSPSTHCCSP